MGTATNPFVELLADFRAAAASLDTRHFGVTAWWYFPKRFTNPKRRVLGICCLPVRYGDEVHFQEFTLSVSVAGNHAKCGPVFCDLASRAGAALPPAIREQLADYVPIYVSEMAPWWFAFLWRVFVGTKPLKHPRSADTDELVETPIPLPLPRPFLLSIDAIERCKLHTDQPVFPPPDEGEEKGKGGATRRTKRPKGSNKPKRGRPVEKLTIQRAEFAEPLREDGESWPKIAEKYRRKHPTDLDASADTIRLACDRHNPEAK